MKYNYDFRFTVLLLVVNELLVIFLSVLSCAFTGDHYADMISRALILTAVLFFGTKQLVDCNKRKSITFLDETMYLDGFLMPDNKKGEPIYIRYANIVSVKAIMLPLVGLHYVKIKSNDRAYIIKISRYFKNHVELFSTMINNMKKAKPNMDIDPKLIAYLDRTVDGSLS